MGFIDSLVGGIGAIGQAVVTGVGAIAANLPAIATTVAQGAQAVQAIQQSLSGNPTVPMMVNPNTGSPMDAQAAFAMACNADPTGACQAQIAAALAGGMMNPNTGGPLGAGVAGGLTQAARQALMNPGVQAALRAIGLGGLIGAGEAGVSALLGAAGGGSVSGVRGPFLMEWPAGVSYPRGIVLRSPDRPEKRYRSLGAPLLSSGDVAAVRRVGKAAARARRGRGRRSSSSRPSIMMLPAGTANVCGSCLTAPCGCK